MSEDGSITICYCENTECHKIYPGSITRGMDLFKRPILPCGHRLARLIFSSFSLRNEDGSGHTDDYDATSARDVAITPEERAAIRSPSERWDALWYPHDRYHKMMLRLLTALEAAEAENARLQEQNRRLQQKCNNLSNKTITDDGLKQILDTVEKAPGNFASNYEHGVLNIIGKAKSGKDLSCCIRLADLKFFSDAKAAIRDLACEVQRLRQKKATEADNVQLRERLEAALDKISDIQANDNWEKADGVCHACGICSGIPDEWQPTDDHCCREMLDLWSNGEPLPWEEAARRAVAESEEKI